MKLNKLLILGTLIGAMVGCSSTHSGNYVDKMNQPQIQAGETKDRDDAKLNPDAWKELNITKNSTNIWVDEHGDIVHNRADGYMFMRASIVNEGDNAVEIKWRCKFYTAQGYPIGEEEYNKTATETTGLGWHREIIWPVKSTMHTDDANVMKCVSPSKRATNGKFEVHDLADDITIYND